MPCTILLRLCYRDLVTTNAQSHRLPKQRSYNHPSPGWSRENRRRDLPPELVLSLSSAAWQQKTPAQFPEPALSIIGEDYFLASSTTKSTGRDSARLLGV
jgi:hypothetical protein